jgi:hypothetical protein
MRPPKDTSRYRQCWNFHGTKGKKSSHCYYQRYGKARKYWSRCRDGRSKRQCYLNNFEQLPSLPDNQLALVILIANNFLVVILQNNLSLSPADHAFLFKSSRSFSLSFGNSLLFKENISSVRARPKRLIVKDGEVRRVKSAVGRTATESLLCHETTVRVGVDLDPI